MDMKIHVTIFNYEREDMLDNLIKEISEQNNITYNIIDDGSSYTKDNMIKFEHTGKKGFWNKWDYALQQCSLMTDTDIFLFIPNDYSQLDFESIRRLGMQNINNLYLINTVNDGRTSCWDIRENRKYNEELMRSYFTDCSFFTNYKTLQKFGFHIEPIHESRFTRPDISSGVGQQLTDRFNKLKVNMYTPHYSFAFHGDHPSTMHPQERTKRPLITKHRKKIVIGVATMNSRKHSFKRMMESINKQTIKPDEVYVYNNDENDYDATDNGKFYYFTLDKKEDVYFFSMDDDILYPPTYIEDMIRWINKYQCIITHHGRDLREVKSNYYTDHLGYSCLQENNINKYIDVMGTGVSAFDTEILKPSFIFKDPRQRMTDLLLAEYASDNNIKIRLVPHTKNYLKDICEDTVNSCHTKEKKNNVELKNNICKRILNNRTR